MRSSVPLLPTMTRMAEYRRDFTGAVELLLTTEDRRLITLRYDHEEDAAFISGIRLPDLPNRLVFASQEQHWFFFPSPPEDTNLVVNALLLPSERVYEPLNAIGIRRETVVPAQFMEQAEGELWPTSGELML